MRYYVVLMLVVGSLVGVAGQDTAQIDFDVASVKPAMPNRSSTRSHRRDETPLARPISVLRSHLLQPDPQCLSAVRFARTNLGWSWVDQRGAVSI